METGPTQQQNRLIDDTEQGNGKSQSPKRVASLDIFRGLTVAMMILVDDAGGQWQMIGHAPWNGCNLADFVMPFFLFIVGMAIALSLKRIPNQLLAVKKVIVRTLKLLFWGILLQGGYSHAPDKLTYGVDMKNIRWCGILQRIALAYLVVALLEIFAKNSRPEILSPVRWSIFRAYMWQWFLGACILVVYHAAIYGTHVPDWEFTVHNSDSPDYGKIFTVTCGVQGKLNPPCNAVGYIDRKVLGINHMYPHPAWRRSKACTEHSPYEGPFRKDAPFWCQAPFEPEGILRPIIVAESRSTNEAASLSLSDFDENKLKGTTALRRIQSDVKEEKSIGSLDHHKCSKEGINVVEADIVSVSISSILTTIIGVHCGRVLLHMKGHSDRLKHWTVMGFVLLISGIVLHFTNAIPLNKQLYSLSYVCLTAGAAALVFSTFYVLVDVLGLRLVFLPLEWIGMNAMLVYVMAAEGIFAGFINGWYYESPHNTLVYWIQKHIFIRVWHSKRVGILLYVIFAEILFWGLVAGILHHLRIYWKL